VRFMTVLVSSRKSRKERMEDTWASLRGTGRGRPLLLLLLLLLLLVVVVLVVGAWGTGAGVGLGVKAGCAGCGPDLPPACARLLLGRGLLVVSRVVAELLLPAACLLLLPLLLGVFSSTSHQSAAAGGGGAVVGWPRRVRGPGGWREGAACRCCASRCFAGGGGRPCDEVS
jgi:hypothetical protein